MAGLTRTAGAFAATPHKISVCILLQKYASSAQMPFPSPFSSVSQRNRLGNYLRSLTKACDDIYEPKLDDLIKQLREVFGEDMDAWLTDHLTLGISSLSSPGDLLNFFNDMRGILDILASELVQENQIFFGSFGSLEIFACRCIWDFERLSSESEGVGHLLARIEAYCKESLSRTSNLQLEQQMAGLTPHKISVCILLLIDAGCDKYPPPVSDSDVCGRNRLGIYLRSLVKNIEEPKLEELMNQLRKFIDWLPDRLREMLSSLSSSEALSNFFTDVGGLDQNLDPDSELGKFVWDCSLVFFGLSSEGILHLLRRIEAYCKEAYSSCAQSQASSSNLESSTKEQSENASGSVHHASASVQQAGERCSSSSVVKQQTPGWWDIENVRPPPHIHPSEILAFIDRALAILGFPPCNLCIVVGTRNPRRMSRELQKEFDDPFYKNRVRVHIVNNSARNAADKYICAELENLPSHTSPTPVLVAGGDHSYTPCLITLRNEGYTCLLAYPDKSVAGSLLSAVAYATVFRGIFTKFAQPRWSMPTHSGKSYEPAHSVLYGPNSSSGDQLVEQQTRRVLAELTPHKISVCILLQIYAQIYAPSTQMSRPSPFSLVSQHQPLETYLCYLTEACDNIYEPKLDDLIKQLREVLGEVGEAWLTDHLTNKIYSLSSPHALRNFFSDIRGQLDGQIIVGPFSSLGMFLHCCISAFNRLTSKERRGPLLTSIKVYLKEWLKLTSTASIDALVVPGPP